MNFENKTQKSQPHRVIRDCRKKRLKLYQDSIRNLRKSLLRLQKKNRLIILDKLYQDYTDIQEDSEKKSLGFLYGSKLDFEPLPRKKRVYYRKIQSTLEKEACFTLSSFLYHISIPRPLQYPLPTTNCLPSSLALHLSL